MFLSEVFSVTVIGISNSKKRNLVMKCSYMTRFNLNYFDERQLKAVARFVV